MKNDEPTIRRALSQLRGIATHLPNGDSQIENPSAALDRHGTPRSAVADLVHLRFLRRTRGLTYAIIPGDLPLRVPIVTALSPIPPQPEEMKKEEL